MKSLLISSQYFPPQCGGISSYMSAVADALGPDRVCCLTGVRPDGSSNGERRVYRRPRAFSSGRLGQAVGFAAAMSEIAVRERPRVVQLASLYEAVYGLLARRWLGLPLAVYAHGNEVMANAESAYEPHRTVLRKADLVIANSRFTADLVQSRAGVHADRVHIVHPICDLDQFRPVPPNPQRRRALLGDRQHARVLLTVGHLTDRKGQDLVIRALPQILKDAPDVVYLIVGDGPNRGDLERLANDVGVRGNVQFAGELPTEFLADAYAQCDVFVMPSRVIPEQCQVEGFGIVYLEAAACGKPVVGGKSGGVGDAVADGKTGILVSPDDPRELAAALSRLLTDGELAQSMGRRGRDRVLESFTPKHLGDRIQGLIDAVVA
jgi:phosphatidylinositol alpha-1,6-mannosyltransferase